MKPFEILCCGVLLSSASLAVACENPSLPNMPPEKGRIRDREERLIQLDTLRYLHEMESYVECLQKQHAAVAGEGEALESSLIAGRNNAAVAELEAVRAAYEARIGPIDQSAWEAAEAERRQAAYQQWRLDDGTQLTETQLRNAAIEAQLNAKQEEMDSVHVRPTSTEERAYRAQRFGN